MQISYPRLHHIFGTIYKWNISSIQCKMRHRWVKTVREVNSLSLIFIYFDNPALTPGLHSAETAPEFTNNKFLLAIYRIQKGVVCKEG
jgi:hypothetical protein